MRIAMGARPGRTPTLLAMSAAGLDEVSDGRFELGIGVSGPQVIEGSTRASTTRLAEGWVPPFYVPEKAADG